MAKMSGRPVEEMSVSILWNATTTPVPQVPPFPAAAVAPDSVSDLDFDLDFTSSNGNSNNNNNIRNYNNNNNNNSALNDYTQMEFMMTMNKVKYYGDPIIFVVGIIGNIIAYLVFTHTRFRKVPSVPYLAGVAVADVGYLITYYMNTLTSVNHLPIMTQMGVCQFGTFANFAFLFLSNWYVVALVTEKFLCVYWPLKKGAWCTTFRNKVVLVCFAVLAVVAYSYVIYFVGPEVKYGQTLCACWKEFYEPFETLMILDSIVVYILPPVAVVVLVVLITIRGCEYYRISSTAADFGSRGAGSGRSGRSRGGPVSSSSTSCSQTLQATDLTYGLVALFILTHFPSCVVLLMGYFNNDPQQRNTLIRISSVGRQIHACSFGVKFLVYLAVSATFRKHTWNLLRKMALCFRSRCCRKGSGGGFCGGWFCHCYACGTVGADDSEAIDPQRISLKGCGHCQPAANACLIQSDV